MLVTFLCGSVVLYTGLVPVLPQEGDAVDLAGVRGHVVTCTLVYTQDEGMSVVAQVRKV